MRTHLLKLFLKLDIVISCYGYFRKWETSLKVTLYTHYLISKNILTISPTGRATQNNLNIGK